MNEIENDYDQNTKSTKPSIKAIKPSIKISLKPESEKISMINQSAMTTPSCDTFNDNYHHHHHSQNAKQDSNGKVYTAISLKTANKPSSLSATNKTKLININGGGDDDDQSGVLSLSPHQSLMTEMESENTTPTVKQLEKMNSMTYLPKHIQIDPHLQLMPIQSLQIRLNPPKQMHIINDSPIINYNGITPTTPHTPILIDDNGCYDDDINNKEYSLPSLPSIPSHNPQRFGYRNYSYSNHSRNNSCNLLSVNMNNAVSSSNMNNIDGDSKLSSIDTMSVTNNTNGVLSELDDSILSENYNDTLDNLLKDIHQIKFTKGNGKAKAKERRS